MNGFNREKDSIGVLGLGYVGIPLSLLLARNFNVVGFDTDGRKINALKRRISPITEPGVEELLNSDEINSNIVFTNEKDRLRSTKIKIITVGTPYDSISDYIDYSQLETALNLLEGLLKEGDIIILKSTVPPGTTSSIVRKRVEDFGLSVPSDVGLAFSPERMVEGQAIKDFLTLPKVIGASDQNTLEIVSEIVGSLGGEIVKVSSPETAEMVKMVDNYSRFVFLGLTNEIALISEQVGVDVLELLNAAKHDYPRNSGLLLPGPGVGGSCLNKDPFILRAHVRKGGLNLKMVDSATEVNRSIPYHVVEIVEKYADSPSCITIAGVSFKGDTDDTRFSPTYEIKNALEKKGFQVRLTDPFVKDSTQSIDHDIYSASSESKVILFLTDHSKYKQLDIRLLKRAMINSPIIVDTRGIIDKNTALTNGFEYHGLGRL